MKTIRSGVRRFMKSVDGPTTVEYAVMLGFIIAICATSIGVVGITVLGLFQRMP